MGELLVCDLCGCDGKYRCPRCDTRSCSMPCVQQHKQISGCDGVRKKINYIPINKFTELDLVQDFRILESVTATIDKCQRDKLKRSTNHHIDGVMAPRISFKRRKLEQEAFRRGVQVKFLPPHFARRQSNQSHFISREKVLRWDVELKLPHAMNKTMKVACVPDTTPLWKLLAPIMEPGLSQDVLGFTEPEAGLSKEDIDEYQGMGYGGVIVYLRTETLLKRRRDAVTGNSEEKNNSRIDRYTELDLKRSLRHNIRGHILVEHPCLEVVRKDEACNYRDQGFVDMMPTPDPRERVEVANTEQQPEDNHDNDMEENNEEEIVDSEAGAYRKYYDFYFDYYRKKYTPTNDVAKSGVNTSKSDNEKGAEEGLPSAMSQLASRLLSTVVSQEQKEQYNVHNSAKMDKTRQNQELNLKNAEKARKIGDEIRESLHKEEGIIDGGAQKKEGVIDGGAQKKEGANSGEQNEGTIGTGEQKEGTIGTGGLPGLAYYTDSEED